MNKVTAFMGSPRKNGNTDIIVKRLMEGIHTLEIDTEILYLSDLSFSGCNGCYSCSRTGKCIKEDDMSFVYPRIEQSDGFIFASPTYNYNITPEMKAFIDRLFCYYQFTTDDKWTSSLGNRKIAYVVGVCAGQSSDTSKPEEDIMGFTIHAMKKPLEDLGIKVVKEIRYYNTRKFPIRNNTDYQNELIKTGEEFIDF